MKYIIQSFAALGLLITLNSCTTYVDPSPAPEPTTTTTTRTTESAYVPGGAVTTQKTTTTY